MSPKGRGSNYRKDRKRKPSKAEAQKAHRNLLRQRRYDDADAMAQYKKFYRPGATPGASFSVWVGDPNVEPSDVTASMGVHPHAKDPDSGLMVPAFARGNYNYDGLAWVASRAMRWAREHGQANVTDGELQCAVVRAEDGRTLIFEFNGSRTGTALKLKPWVLDLQHLVEGHGNRQQVPILGEGHQH
jgi:hypothetical protein